MQKAIFSIINYQFDKVLIDLANQTDEELNLSFDTRGIFYIEKSVFELIFKVSVNNNNSNNSFVEVQCKGMFKIEQCSKLDEIPDFFFRNSIAILFPYVRAYVSLITTQANISGIILPTLNLSGLEMELKKNTTQK